MAERVGFEPTRRLPAYGISSSLTGGPRGCVGVCAATAMGFDGLAQTAICRGVGRQPGRQDRAANASTRKSVVPRGASEAEEVRSAGVSGRAVSNGRSRRGVGLGAGL